MLPRASVHRFAAAAFLNVDSYRRIVGDELIDEIIALARELRGVRVCHINSTGFGGGVAELLSRLVPLANALGVDTDWRLLQGTPEFFTFTKALHNGLQGAHYAVTDADIALYLDVNRLGAAALDPDDYDVFVVHDPQPAAFHQAIRPNRAKWIWRCHIDTSSPDKHVAEFLLPHIQHYDAVVFTMRDFLLPGLSAKRAVFIAPAIDPCSTKNMELPLPLCREVVANAGVDPRRPLIVQVSRFDPWKDPLGVIEAYREAKTEVRGLQLALVGAIAGDDPEGWQLLSAVEEEAAHDDDIFVFTNLAGVGSMEVNAFQRAADVVIQKSLREGFGLVVSEAFWKGRPVVARRAGGIAMQFPEGYERYLVRSTVKLAARVVELLHDPDARRPFGEAGREHVRQCFLTPRLVRDELKLIRGVLTGEIATPIRSHAPAAAGAR